MTVKLGRITIQLATAGLLLTGCTFDLSAAGSNSDEQLQQSVTTESNLPSTAEEDAALLRSLSIKNESSDLDYDRDNWPHWTSVDGCDTRSRVLKNKAYKNVPIEVNEKCTVIAGAWSDTFAGRHVMDAPPLTNPNNIDIDHVVPLSEAHRSGGSSWSEKRREAFANDTDMVLVPMSSQDNRAKGDSDPSEWMPENQCLYASYWIGIKAEWSLSVDNEERNALVNALNTCPDR